MNLEEQKLKGYAEFEPGDIIYQLGMEVGVAQKLPKGALPYREKPVGDHIVADGKWVPVK